MCRNDLRLEACVGAHHLGRRPVFRQTRTAFLQHENAKAELKSLVPEDAQEAIGHGLRAKRSKSGAISFDLLALEEHHAALQ